jgi:hypothetical protein
METGCGCAETLLALDTLSFLINLIESLLDHRRILRI